MADQALIARSRTLAKLALASAVLLVVLVLLLLFVVDHTTVSEAFLILWGLFLLLAAIILGVALAYVFMTQGLKAGVAPENGTVLATGGTGSALPPEVPESIARSVAPEAALRLLSGDERRIYWRIVEAGGAALQKDLVGALPFSGSKVSRILDRLEGKGLVERERHGMTNRIRVSNAWQQRP